MFPSIPIQDANMLCPIIHVRFHIDAPLVCLGRIECFAVSVRSFDPGRDRMPCFITSECLCALNDQKASSNTTMHYVHVR
jgi:hypothetical protein